MSSDIQFFHAIFQTMSVLWAIVHLLDFTPTGFMILPSLLGIMQRESHQHRGEPGYQRKEKKNIFSKRKLSENSGLEKSKLSLGD